MAIIIKEKCPTCWLFGGMFVCSFGAINCSNCGEFIRMATEDELDQMSKFAKEIKKKREEEKL